MNSYSWASISCSRILRALCLGLRSVKPDSSVLSAIHTSSVLRAIHTSSTLCAFTRLFVPLPQVNSCAVMQSAQNRTQSTMLTLRHVLIISFVHTQFNASMHAHQRSGPPPAPLGRWVSQDLQVSAAKQRQQSQWRLFLYFSCNRYNNH